MHVFRKLVLVVLEIHLPDQGELMQVVCTDDSFGWSLTRLSAGIRIDIRRAMMAMTTKSSISVKPLRFLTKTPLLARLLNAEHVKVGILMLDE